MWQKRKKKSLVSFLFYPLAPLFSCCVCVQATGLCEATALHVGGQSGTDGWGDDPPPPGRPELRFNCHSKSQHVDLCEWRFVCQGTIGVCVMALRVPRQTGSPRCERLILRQHLFHGKFSPFPSASSPHTQKS